MRKFGLFLLFIFWSFTVSAQVLKLSAGDTSSEVKKTVSQTQKQPQKEVVQKNNQISPSDSSSEDMKEDKSVKDFSQMKGFLKNSGNQKDARNIMILREVINYKMGDEELAPDFKKLENNREYNKKLQTILDEINNKKNRNRKNKQVMQILNEAGNKIYNLLAD